MMGASINRRKFGIMGIVLLLSMPGLAGADDSTSVRLRYESDVYREMGTAAADVDYSGTRPFMTGYVTGMLIPFTTAASAAMFDSALGKGDGFGGLAGFALTIWGGKKIADAFSEPAADRYQTTFTSDRQHSFNQGFAQRIHEKRLFQYSAGVFWGVMTDLGILLTLLYLAGPLGTT